jgi:hypothetical protein
MYPRNWFLFTNTEENFMPTLTVTIPAGSTTATFHVAPSLPDGNRTIAITSTPALTIAGSPLTINVTNPATTLTLSGLSTIQAGGSSVYTLTLDNASTIPVVVTITDTQSGFSNGGNSDNLTTQ